MQNVFNICMSGHQNCELRRIYFETKNIHLRVNVSLQYLYHYEVRQETGGEISNQVLRPVIITSELNCLMAGGV